VNDIFPAPSTATHKDAEAHEIPKMLKWSTLVTVHELATVGVVEVTMLPALSPATHKVEVGHEMDCRPPGTVLALSTGAGAAHESGCEASAGGATTPIKVEAPTATTRARSQARRGADSGRPDLRKSRRGQDEDLADIGASYFL
jgi:hypothetical protein